MTEEQDKALLAVVRAANLPAPTATVNPAAMELAGYLLSEDYRGLLRRAIAARLATTSNHAREHIKALDLFDAAFRERPDEA